MLQMEVKSLLIFLLVKHYFELVKYYQLIYAYFKGAVVISYIVTFDFSSIFKILWKFKFSVITVVIFEQYIVST